jgi:hypothetical protein
MDEHIAAFVGIDTSKLRNSVAIAEEGRTGEVRFFGEIDNTPDATAKLVRSFQRSTSGWRFVTRLARPDMGCTGRSPIWGKSAWWRRPRSFQRSLATE